MYDTDFPSKKAAKWCSHDVQNLTYLKSVTSFFKGGADKIFFYIFFFKAVVCTFITVSLDTEKCTKQTLVRWFYVPSNIPKASVEWWFTCAKHHLNMFKPVFNTGGEQSYVCQTKLSDAALPISDEDILCLKNTEIFNILHVQYI